MITDTMGMVTIAVSKTTLFLVFASASPFLLWLFYLAVMAARRAQQNGTLTLTAKVLGFPILMVGGVLDVFCNMTICTIILLETPREWLVTTRLRRWVDSPTWRGSVARWFGKHLLDPFDPSGSHLH